MGRCIETSRTFYSIEGEQSLDLMEGITKLYQDRVQRRLNSVGWNYRAEVLKMALQLFGRLPEWYRLQCEFPAGEYQVRFLQDTFQYIATGKRKMSPLTMRELLIGSANTTSKTTTYPKDYDPFEVLGTRLTANVIAKWCQHPGGFDDMLCTLYVLFGTSRENSPEN